jgi:tetratricopeptide (TPR) repeat protein
VAELRFRRGDVAGAFETLEAALETLAQRPSSTQKAYALSSLSRFRTAGEPEQAIRIGREALAMAEELELDEVRAHALNNIGTSRMWLGDHGGVADLEQSLEISVALGSVEAVRGYLNLGTTLANLGDLERAFAVHAEGRRTAKRFGDAIGIRWFAIERLFEDYWRGRWDDALVSADALLTEVAGEPDYYTELGARIVRGWIRLGRGNAGGAREDTGRHLELAREVRYPQALFPALAQAARMYATTGARDQAERYAGELLDEWRASIVETATYWTADLAFALVDLGRGVDLVEVGEAIASPTAWLEAACAFAAGDAKEAAARYAAIGSLPDEAFARIRSDDRRADDFVRRVGAVGYA